MSLSSADTARTTIDVPPAVDLVARTHALDKIISLTCNYTLSCDQHRPPTT